MLKSIGPNSALNIVVTQWEIQLVRCIINHKYSSHVNRRKIKLEKIKFKHDQIPFVATIHDQVPFQKIFCEETRSNTWSTLSATYFWDKYCPTLATYFCDSSAGRCSSVSFPWHFLWMSTQAYVTVAQFPGSWSPSHFCDYLDCSFSFF